MKNEVIIWLESKEKWNSILLSLPAMEWLKELFEKAKNSAINTTVYKLERDIEDTM